MGVRREDGEKAAAPPLTLHRLLQPTSSSHPHAGGMGKDEAHRGRRGRTTEKMGVRREDGEKAAATPPNIPRLPQAPSPQLHAGGGHRGGYASRNAAPVPPRDAPLDYYPPKHCKCEKQCLKLISWEDGNEGRRYYRCSQWYEWTARDCKYFEWIDPHYSPFLRTLLLDLCDKVRTLEKDVADEKIKSKNMQTRYEMRLRVIHKQLQEKEKQLDAKDAALQVLSARKTFGTQMGSIIFMFAAGVLFVTCWKTMDS